RVAVQRRFLDQPPLGDQRLQARVQSSVTEGAEHSERGVEPLAQLVAVHRGLTQQAEDRELEDSGALAKPLAPFILLFHLRKPRVSRPDVWSRYIVTIERPETSCKA